VLHQGLDCVFCLWNLLFAGASKLSPSLILAAIANAIDSEL